MSLSFVSASSGQNFQGQVIERSLGIPIRELPVSLYRRGLLGDELVRTVTTDTAGWFMADGVGAGEYQLLFGFGKRLQSQWHRATRDTTIAERYEVAFRESTCIVPLFDFQATEPARELGGPSPRYPELLRDRGISGVVLTQFVIDTTGVLAPGSMQILKTDHHSFSEAVRASMEQTRFRPARFSGMSVCQLVQQPFEFSLTRPRIRPR